MSCSKILEMVYESQEDSISIFTQIQVWIHTFFCQDCAQEIERYETARQVMREDFFPSAPGLENSIMAKIAAEEIQEDVSPYAIPGGFSTRAWVITGLVIFISFATAFLGFDFRTMASEYGVSFLLPVGITIGLVLSAYGVFFIGSHLKELTERFGL